jgi:hypothetical protein
MDSSLAVQEEPLRVADQSSLCVGPSELLHVLMLPDFDRADAIGSYWGHPDSRLRQLLIT